MPAAARPPCRLLHLWFDETDARRIVPPALADRLAQMVASSEARHGGEVRLCVEGSLPLSYLWRQVRQRLPMAQVLRERALMMFAKLGVWDTVGRNGVLVYLNLAAHAIEIVPDRALAASVPQAQWQAIADSLAGALRQRQFEAGLTGALAAVTELMVQHAPQAQSPLCPSGAAAANQLPDTVVLC